MSGSGLEFLTSLLPWVARRPRIFISYRRRGDSAGFAARLADRLVAHFGDEQCFRDIEDIETGADFVEAIEEAVASSRVMVVVIGTDWATVQDAHGRRRLDNPDDFVRIEVATALRRGIRVVPVLVAGATMPSGAGLPEELQGLFRRQALELTDSRWDYDVGQLTTAIEGMGIKSREKRAAARFVRRLRWGGVAVAAAALVWLGLSLPGLMNAGGDPAGTQGPMDASPAADAPPPTQGRDGAQADALPQRTRDVASESVDEPETTSAAPPEERSTRSSATEPSLVERYRPALVEAIDAGNEEQNYAQETLDVSGLADVFTGAALQLHVASVAQLFQAGELAFNTMLSQRYGAFRVDPTGTTAQVDLVERWTAEHRSALTGVCMHRIPAYDVPQTVHLRRMGGGWIIEDISGDPVTIPDAVGC